MWQQIRGKPPAGCSANLRTPKAMKEYLYFLSAGGEKSLHLAGVEISHPSLLLITSTLLGSEFEMTSERPAGCHFEPFCGEKSLGKSGVEISPFGIASVEMTDLWNMTS